MDEFVYDAFISYSHRDMKWARWLQRRLETFRIPKDLCGGNAPRGHLKVFRDQTDLSGVELQNALQRELEASRFLIVICSPFSAASPWVNDEIRSFQTRGRSKFIIPFIVDGEPESDKPELECFPPALRSVEGEHPLGASAVELGKNKAFLKLMAVILDVRFNRLVDREKQRKRRTVLLSSAAAAVIIAVLASLLWRNAVIRKQNQEMIYDNYLAALVAAGQQNNFTPEDISRLKASAEAGNRDAAFYLASCYKNGWGTEANPEEAFRWFSVAAEAGDTVSMTSLANCYMEGVGAEKDLAKGFAWQLRAAEAGDPGGMYLTGLAYEGGIGTDKNPAEAFRWYRKAADLGYEQGYAHTANCYLMGIGTDVNLEEAFHWLKKLAEAGNPEGMYYLGMLYQFGKGTAEDPRQAYLWYRRAAEAGYPDGMYMTGWCLENQYGVGDEALEWYRRAQEGGIEAAGADIARLEAAEENESPPSG